ncbi:MAG: PIN domain-containing protein [Rhodoferax sp.]|nr:PIN domain-containing protein [Rhodoferax sp.]
MIAVDTNLLVYAHRVEVSFHARAFACLERLAQGSRPWGIPVSCLHEFLSIVTNPKIFRPASDFEQALDQVDAWLASPQAHVLHSGAQHWRILSDLTRKAKLQGGQFHDARIAAICMENGVSVLYSADRDFGRFQALKTVNPLVD